MLNDSSAHLSNFDPCNHVNTRPFDTRWAPISKKKNWNNLFQVETLSRLFWTSTACYFFLIFIVFLSFFPRNNLIHLTDFSYGSASRGATVLRSAVSSFIRISCLPHNNLWVDPFCFFLVTVFFLSATKWPAIKTNNRQIGLTRWILIRIEWFGEQQPTVTCLPAKSEQGK